MAHRGASSAALQRKLKKPVDKDDSLRLYFISAEDVKRIALLGGAAPPGEGEASVTADRPFILH